MTVLSQGRYKRLVYDREAIGNKYKIQILNQYGRYITEYAYDTQGEAFRDYQLVFDYIKKYNPEDLH